MKKTSVVSAAAAEQKPNKRHPGDAKGFVEEMRFGNCILGIRLRKEKRSLRLSL